jgi:hypothetical protein
MKRLKFAWIVVVVGLWHCGGDGEKGTAPVATVDPPQAPRALSVERIGDGEVWLNWQAAEGADEVLYVVYRSVGDAAAVAIDSTFETRFKDQGLQYELEYTYRVTAINGGGESDPSNAVSGQPLNSLTPQVPTLLRAVAHHLEVLGQLDITLDWNENPETDLIGYRVYRSTEAGFTPRVEHLILQVSVPGFIDEEIEVGTVYYYRITAIDGGGKESNASEEVSDVALPSPVLLVPVAGAETAAPLTFTWSRLPEARAFRVIVTTSLTSGEVSDIPLTSDTTAVFTGRIKEGRLVTLEPGQVYYWKVVASTHAEGIENSVSRVESFKVAE